MSAVLYHLKLNEGLVESQHLYELDITIYNARIIQTRKYKYHQFDLFLNDKKN